MMPSSMMPALVPLDIAALAVLACLAVGGVLLALGSLVPATAPQARPLWPVYGTELVIVGGGLGPFVAGGLVLSLALAALATRVAYEAVNVAWRRHLRAGGNAGSLRLAAEVLLFPGLPLALFVAVGVEPANAGVLVLAFLLVETYDSYALFGGKLFGRHPAFPRLSPRKTVEGLAGGAAMLALTAALAGPLLLGWSLALSLAAAAVIAVAAVVGDLAGSRLKRASGVKDYPQVLPRQGGLLDIVDAWLIAGPALVLLLRLAP